MCSYSSVYRRHVRAWLFRTRGDRALCDYPGCTIGATDMHELVNRGRTNKDTWQRLLTYQPELCSLLCWRHHGEAHNPKVRKLLFRVNYERYGVENVTRAYALLKLAWPAIDIVLPASLEMGSRP